MITAEEFAEMALDLPGTEETKHFDRRGFKVTGKRMFATYLASNHTANVFLTPELQTELCTLDPTYIYPVPNKWGEKGATTMELHHVDREVVLEALRMAYELVRPPKSK